MPIQAVSQNVADAINHLRALLQKEYGTNFSYSINGNGFTLAQHNKHGIEHPVPSVKHFDNSPNLGNVVIILHTGNFAKFVASNMENVNVVMINNKERFTEIITEFQKHIPMTIKDITPKLPPEHPLNETISDSFPPFNFP